MRMTWTNSTNIIRSLAAVTLLLLTWQCKFILDRINALENHCRSLERNQILVLTKLGITPLTKAEPREKPGLWAGLAAAPINQENQTPEKKLEFSQFSP
jgi:hypothetical protein